MDLAKLAAEAPEIATVERVAPEPGDVFVLTYDGRLSAGAAEHISEEWERAIPGTHAIVLENGLKIQKLQPRMTEAIDALNALSGDSEVDHSAADSILLDVLKDNGLGAVAEAFRAAKERVGFWYA